MQYSDKFWSEYFEYYDSLLNWIAYRELMTSLVENLALNDNDRLLDHGAGTGNIQYFIDKQIDIVSIDNSQPALDRLKQKFPESKTLKTSIEDKLPFEDNTFNKVVSNNVLYTIHRDKWEIVVNELKRVCQPNALIVISNVTEEFSPIAMYLDQIKTSIKQKGYFKTIAETLKLLYPTIQMFRYNRKIVSNNTEGNYSFLQGDEQIKIFEQLGFKNIKPTRKVYSQQANLNVFQLTKP